MDTQIQPATNTPIQEKWGTILNHGFVVIPSVLLRYQHKIGINDGEMIVLLNLVMSWWRASEHPFPRAETIAKRMGVSDRTVQRHLMKLEEKRLIRRIRRTDRRDNTQAAVKYDLTGLVRALNNQEKFATTMSETETFLSVIELFDREVTH